MGGLAIKKVEVEPELVPRLAGGGSTPGCLSDSPHNTCKFALQFYDMFMFHDCQIFIHANCHHSL